MFALSLRFLRSIWPFMALAVVYGVAYANPSWRYDATAVGEFTPLPEVVELLSQAPTPISAIAFYGPTSFGRVEAVRYLEALQAADSRFSYQISDPNLDQPLALAYGVQEDGVVVFIRERGQASQRTAELYFLSDRDVYAVLRQLIYPRAKLAYFVVGHGEADVSDFGDFGLSQARQLLEDVGFSVEPLDLRLAGGVPPEADVVAVINPQRPWTAEEIAALHTYTAQGGALFMAADVLPNAQVARAEETGLAPYWQEVWGLTLRPDIVIDPPLTYFEQVFTFVVQDFGLSPIITTDIRQFSLLLSAARSIAITPLDGVRVVALLRTSGQAWGEVDLDTFPPVREPADTAGPLVVAVSAEAEQSGGRLVLVGDTDWLLNRGIYSGANSILAVNSFQWLAGDEETLTLAPRPVIPRTLVLTQTQILALQLASLAAAPLLFAILGLYGWYIRRWAGTG